MNATISPAIYSLSNVCPANWPTNASFTVVASYPFTSAPADESPDDFVLRTYYETLWMPEVIASLSRFIPTLRRVRSSSDASTGPLRSLVTPLLLSMKDLSAKYRVEIPQMITSGGTGEDAEEAMILFAWTHEKRPESNSKPLEPDGSEKEALWTKKWLQRFERRDAMIQVLLHFLVLSLPEDSDSPSTDKKRKRKGKRKANASKGLQDNLDMLIDRLCIWRETQSHISENAGPSTSSSAFQAERDWLQAFCDDVVRPTFATVATPLYESFRSKCFPDIFEDIDETDADEPGPSFAPDARKIRGLPVSRQSSMEPSSLQALKGKQRATQNDALSRPLPARTLTRSSSVVSNTGGANSSLVTAGSRREVSMRRSVSVQRDPSVGPTGLGSAPSAKGKEREKDVAKPGGAMKPRVPVRTSSNPQRESQPHLPVPSHPLSKQSTLFVPETPAGARTFGRSATLSDFGFARPKSSLGWNSQVKQESMGPDPFALDDDEDTPMEFSEEPESIYPNGGAGGSRGSILVQETPQRARSYSLSSSTAHGSNTLSAGQNGNLTLPSMVPETPTK
ncbi:hypothetical protein DL93DRAFT_2233933 [Clavulina sp. PMI_390]|nr:hypothetical protein DL93DRAFT_2233933 [Clavulina sp. PMI_390]